VVGVMRVSEVPKPLAAKHPVLDAPIVSWSNYDTSEVDALAANRLIVLFHDNITDLDTGLSRWVSQSWGCAASVRTKGPMISIARCAASGAIHTPLAF
jgi:hypothetical protein